MMKRADMGDYPVAALLLFGAQGLGTLVSAPCPSDSLLEIIFRIFIPLSHHIGA